MTPELPIFVISLARATTRRENTRARLISDIIPTLREHRYPLVGLPAQYNTRQTARLDLRAGEKGRASLSVLAKSARRALRRASGAGFRRKTSQDK